MLDLREYTAAHAGTRYEIFQIMNVAPIEKVIVLIGVGDDEQAIAAELRTAWNAMRRDLTQSARHAPAIRVLAHAHRAPCRDSQPLCRCRLGGQAPSSIGPRALARH